MKQTIYESNLTGLGPENQANLVVGEKLQQKKSLYDSIFRKMVSFIIGGSLDGKDDVKGDELDSASKVDPLYEKKKLDMDDIKDVPTNPFGIEEHEEKKEKNEKKEEKKEKEKENKESGGVFELGTDVESIIEECVNAGLPQFGDKMNGLIASKDYTPTKLPSLYTLANLSALICDMPRCFGLNEKNGRQGVDWDVYYRWSDGSYVKEIEETMIKETLRADFYVSDSMPAILTREPNYLFSVDIDPSFAEALGNPMEESKHARVMRALLGGKDDAMYMKLVCGYAGLIDSGDNHVTFLVNMMRYYYSALVVSGSSGDYDMGFRVPKMNYHYVTDANGWYSAISEYGVCPVSCRVNNQDYLHFLNICAMKGTSKYPAYMEGRKYCNKYDTLDFQWNNNLSVISTFNHNLDDYRPCWVGNTVLIKGYIETYIHEVGLKQQADEAFGIIKVLPELCMLDEGLTLPEPIHTADVFSQMINKTGGASALSEGLDFAPARQIMSGVLVSGMIDTALCSFAEGLLFDRDNKDITADVVRAVLGRINFIYSKKKSALVNIISLISGVDLSFMYQMGIEIYVMKRLVHFMTKGYSTTLYRLLMAKIVKGSYCDFLRKGVKMECENLNSQYLRIPYELAKGLKFLGYETDSLEFDNPWTDKPIRTTDNLSLKLTKKKKNLFWAMKDKIVRLNLERIDFENRPEFQLADSGDEVKDIIADFLASLDNKQPSFKIIKSPPSKLSERKMTDEKTAGELVVKTEVRTSSKKVVVEVPEYLKKEGIDANKLASILKKLDPKATTMNFNDERTVEKERIAGRLYMFNEEDNTLAREYVNNNKFESIPNRGSGDCGPLSILDNMTHYGEHEFIRAGGVSRVREYSADKLGIEVVDREWWTVSDFTGLGCKIGRTIIIVSKKRDNTEECFMAYKVEGSFPYVVLHSNGIHYEAYVPVEDSVVPLQYAVEVSTSSKKEKKEIKNMLKKMGSVFGLKEKTTSTSPELGQNTHVSGKVADSGWKSLRKIFCEYDSREYNWIKDVVTVLGSVSDKHNITVDVNIFLTIKKGLTSIEENVSNKMVEDYYMKPLIYSNVDIKDINVMLPLWSVCFKKVYDRELTWRMVEGWFSKKYISKDLLVLWHCLLWPFHNLPTAYQTSKVGKFEKKGCGCLGCNVMTKNFECPKINEQTVDKCCSYSRKERFIKKGYCKKSLECLLPVTNVFSLIATQRKDINSYFPFSSQTGFKKSNVDVGTVISLCGSMKICPNKWKLVRKIVLMRKGDSNNLTSSILLYIIGNTLSPNGLIALNKSGFLGCCTTHWLEHFKDFHEEIRVSHRYDGFGLVPEDHSQLLYLHLLYGRMGVEVDWVEEKKKRTRQRSELVSFDGFEWTEEQFKKDISTALDSIIGRMKKPNMDVLSLEEFYQKRWTWMASGSASGKGNFMNPMMAKEVAGEDLKKSDLKNNKRAIGEKLSLAEIENYLGKKPSIRAFSHTKANELGKTRSIFGVELEHYILHSYWCTYVESCIVDPQIAIKEDVARGVSELLQRQDWAISGEVLNSFDFSDFNDQHRLWVIKLLHDKITDRLCHWFKGKDNCSDLNIVGRWIANSFLDTQALDPVSGNYYKWSGGMHSGNRATTVINTLLNKAYTDVVRMCHNREAGFDCVKKAFHTGDDVVMVMADYASSKRFNEISDLMGIEATQSKLLNDRGVMEYLRLTYYPDGSILGSLCRSIGSFVNGNWENEVEVEPHARAQACWEQCAVLMRRGMDAELCRALMLNLLNYYTRMVDKKGISMPLDMKVVMARVEKGGLGLGEIGTGNTLEPINNIPLDRNVGKIRMNIKSIKNKLKSSSDYVKVLNLKELPRWAKIRDNDRERAIGAFAESTIGLEIPRKLGDISEINTQLTREKEYALKSVLVEPRRDMSDIKTVLSSSRDNSREINKLNYYNKMKTILPLLSYDAGYGEKDLIAKIRHGATGRTDLLEVSQNRTDGGRVPPQLDSIIRTHCALNSLNAEPFYNCVLADSRLRKIRY